MDGNNNNESNSKKESGDSNNDADKIDLSVYCDYAKAYEEKVQRDLLDNFRVKFDNFYSELTLHKSGKVDECVEKLRKSGRNSQ